MSDSEPVPKHKMTVWLMVALIVILLIGIATRWEFIRKDVTESVQRYFSEEPTDSGDREIA